MEKEPKSGLSILNWILVVGGILLLTSFIVLPPVFRIVFKEEKPPVKEESQKRKVNCMKTTNEEGIDGTYQYFIDVENESINLVSFTKIEKYTQVPEEIINECNTSNQTYASQDGLYYNCQVLENQLTQDARVTRSTYTGPALPFMIDFKQNYSTIKEELTSTGFTCEEEK